MRDIRFHCPKCNGKLVVDERAMGRSIACPECKETIKIPLRSEDPEPAPVKAAQPQAAGATAGDGHTCTRCGKKVILDTNVIVNQCREVGIGLSWGTMGPTVSISSDHATGLADIYEVVSRGLVQKLSEFESIIYSWAPRPQCPKCGELWCQKCIMGPFPYNSMKRAPHCKCE